MQEYPNVPKPLSKRPVLPELFRLVGFLILCFFGGQLLGLVIAALVLGMGFAEISNVIVHSTGDAESRTVILVTQAVSAFCSFILIPVFYVTSIEKRPLRSLGIGRVQMIAVILTILSVIAFMSFNAIFIELNKNLDLPDWLGGLERWIQQKEEMAERLTQSLITFNSVSQLLIGLVVIALIPAVGEELVFRGVVQAKLFGLTRNVHAAVWFAAFIFSFFHFQFYGFIPRMLLGVLFGYLYAWSGNLLYPIIGHFTNNAFTLIMFFFYQRKAVPIDIEDTASVPLAYSLIGMVITALILVSLKNYFTRFREPRNEELA